MKPYNISEVAFTKYLFFTGKGGVGKTSVACATAIGLADRGKKILLISTDLLPTFRMFRPGIERTRYVYS